ncbi:MAG: hypothetical protein RIQ97_2914 [Pseudomonadota bacterium]|jgi:DNA repair protein RadC
MHPSSWDGVMPPREKILTLGPQALTDAELLALLLRTGLRGQPVLALAQSLLTEHDGLAGLLLAETKQLRQSRGLGPARRAELMGVLEIVRRALQQQLSEREAMLSPQMVRDYLQLHLGHLPHEVFAVMFLDSQHRLIALEPMFRGTLGQTSVYPREILLRALHHHCAAVVLAHNHPSGMVQPSHSDEALTRSLKTCLGLVDIRVLDHIIVSRGQSLSMAERGLL